MLCANAPNYYFARNLLPVGNQTVSRFTDAHQKRAFTRHLLNDIRALEWLLENDKIEKGIHRIGAEQELVIVGNDFRPAHKNIEILKRLKGEHFTTEIAKFNLEINLDPQVFEAGCLTKMEAQLREMLLKTREAADLEEAKILLTGILPTIKKEHLHFEHMTPNERYKALNEAMHTQKGEDFSLYIIGLDELKTTHPNILFEACNTSFQVHLQLDADEFTERYNWSQLIAAPVLAASANSPVLMGKRLWSETRIALFQQSVDTRNAGSMPREKEPRVSFGHEWLEGTVADLYKDHVSRFNLLFASDIDENSLEVAKNGQTPNLEALKLHNGTVYRWNRACFGTSNGKPHLRIENRYIPSGPTVKDEMANTAFWLGLMSNKSEPYGNITENMAFESARFNFYNAARFCMDAKLQWFGKTIAASDLILEEMLPLSRDGLKTMKLEKEEYEPMLELIEERAKRMQNGSKWGLRNFSRLLEGSTPNEASRILSQAMYTREVKGAPVHEWSDLDLGGDAVEKRYDQISQVMTTDVYTVAEDELVDLVISMMDWKNIRFIPVENEAHELVGLVTYKTLLNYFVSFSYEDNISVQDIMLTEFPTCDPSCKTAEAIDIMAREKVSCLPVVDKHKLIGIVTESDIVRVTNKTGKFSG